MRRLLPGILLFALATSLAFVAADVHASRSASPVYLGDVVVHAFFLPAWLRPWK